MTDETQASESQPEVTETIESIASQFNVPTAPVQPQAAEPAAPSYQAPPSYVDPLDENQWKSYQDASRQQQTALQSQVQELTSKLTQYEQSQMEQKVTADIKSAVDKASELSGLDNKDYVEFKLEKRAQDDANFKKIWENREANPQALEKALGIIANEIKGELDFKQDPQLAENHRAATQSQQSSGNPQESEHSNPIEEALANANSPEERDMIWRRFSRGG